MRFIDLLNLIWRYWNLDETKWIFFMSSIHFQRYKLAMEWRNENFDAIDWQISIWFWRSYILNVMEWIHLMNLTKFQCSWLEIHWKFRCAQLDLLNWFWSMVQLFRYCSAILQVKNKKMDQSTSNNNFRQFQHRKCSFIQ